MPQAIAAAAAWVGSTVMTAVGTTLTATGVTAAVGGATALGIAHGVAMFAYTVSEIALWAGMSYAVDTALKPKLKPAGSELLFNMDPAYPREMIIGQRLVGGSMVARYSRGSNLYNAHMVIQVADHPCVELSKVYDGGRVVRDTPLTHGTRTEITAYSNSGGARVWMTWWDGRPGQTADTDLITKSAQDPDVVAGKLPGWSSDHVGAGCAYIHVEVQWDSDILTSIPQFTWLVKGAKLYDRRLDTTAGGSGSHRLDDPSTWEYTDNAAVAADHFLLGYKVEDDDLAFGIGLHPSEVPYDVFANAADLSDEDVETGTVDAVETIKRYVVNGVVSTADYFEDVLEAFQIQMAARFVDLGGRIGILGAEERDISLDLSDQDLTSDDQMQFADKLSFDDLYGAVSGTFSDPANLYQQTPYETQYTAYNALPDGGEAQQVQLSLPYEIHPRRAVRNVSAWLNRESLQPRLVGVFMAVAWPLEPGDWFTFTSERLQLTSAKFEVIDIAKNDDFTVLITARAIDPEFLAFSVDDDPDLSVPPDVEPVSLVLDTPAFTPTATTISGGGATEPVIQVVTTAPNPVTRELVIEAQEWNGSALTGPVLFFVGHADNLTSILRQGLKPATAYKVRMKARAGARESAWSAWSTAITMSSTYVVPLAGGATGDLSDALDDIDAEIAAADARLDSAEDTLDLHGTDIGTLETVTAGHASSITGLRAEASHSELPSTFDQGDLYWTRVGGSYVAEAGVGAVWQTSLNAESQRSRGRLPLRPGHTYRISARYRIKTNSTSGTTAKPLSGITLWDEAGNNISGLFPNSFVDRTEADGWVTVSAEYTTTAILGVDADAVTIDAYIQPNWHDTGAPNAVAQVHYLHLQDLTDIASANASITEVQDVQADQDSAIATLDSRLDATETDIDGVQSTASNLSTRMAAVDGGSASATSIAQLKAAYGFGFNECTDSEFLDIDNVWQNLYSASGAHTYFGSFDANQRRYITRSMTGMTVGHQFNIGQVPGYGLQVTTGDRVEASLYFGVTNTGRISNAICYVDWYDNDGNYLISSTAGSGTSPYNRIGGFATAPSGARRATLTGGFIASHAEPDAHIQGPVLRKCSAEQTALSPYTRSGDPSTLARVGGAEASITEVESVNVDQDSAIATIDSRMDAAETDIDGVQSTASNLSTRMTAVDGGSASSVTLSSVNANVTALRGGQADALPSTFEGEDLYWTRGGGGGTYAAVAGVGRVFQATSGAYSVRSRGRLQIKPNRVYRFTARYRVTANPTNGTTLQPLAGITCWDEAGNNIAGIWTGSFVTRSTADGWVTVSGDYSTADILGVDADTVSIDAYCQPGWSPSGTTDSTEQVQFVSLSDVTDVVSLGARVDTLDEAFVDPTTGLAIARFVKEASATGGRPARLSLYSDSEGTSNVALDAKEIFFGDNTTFEDEFNSFYTEADDVRTRWGGPFGVSEDLFLWQGPTTVDLNDETSANGTFALASDGLHINQAAALPPTEATDGSVTINSTSDTLIASQALSDLQSGDKLKISVVFPQCETDTNSTILWTLDSGSTTLSSGSLACNSAGNVVADAAVGALAARLFDPSSTPSNTIYLYGRRSSGIIDVTLDAYLLVEVVRSGISFLPP